MSGKIPTFNNPTIAEALCEMHFQTADGTGLSNGSFDRVADALRSDYPQHKDQETQDYEAVVGPQGVAVKPVGSPSKKRVFKHKEREHLVQVGSNILTVNELSNYPGWKVFEPDILSSLESMAKAEGIKSLSRIGIRYINKIPRGNEEPVGNWLKDNNYYPTGILSCVHKFASRFEFRHDDEVRAVVTVAEGIDQKGDLPILFDIDCIIESEIPIDNGSVSKAINKLHDLSWGVFGNSLTDRYKKFLDEGK